jgi:membrane protein insertase Oxa1/YidC/SpoIIIJ
VTEILDNLFIRSLLEIYDAIFSFALSALGPVFALAMFSWTLNLILLPLYYQMERAGREGRARQDQMNKEIARIKAHYKGRERYFYVRAIHRQFRYHPISTVLASGDLYLQVLVFMTVYRYLSAHPTLAISSNGFIPSLGRPDGMLFGGNLLPVMMTVLNLGSARLYATDPGRRKQAYALAAVFLVLLYASPAGLVLYWTFNNVFSLARNFIERKVVPLLPEAYVARLSAIARQE